MNSYVPRPIDTSSVTLGDNLMELREQLAENTHDNWAKLRMKGGWSFGPERNDSAKTHPNLCAYDELPESEKEYDRRSAIETLKTIVALGYRIERA